MHNPFFCSQNNFDRKNCCDVFICLQHQNDRNVIIKCLHHQVQKSKQKYVTERYGGLYNYSTLRTMNAMKHVI